MECCISGTPYLVSGTLQEQRKITQESGERTPIVACTRSDMTCSYYTYSVLVHVPVYSVRHVQRRINDPFSQDVMGGSTIQNLAFTAVLAQNTNTHRRGSPLCELGPIGTLEGPKIPQRKPGCCREKLGAPRPPRGTSQLRLKRQRCFSRELYLTRGLSTEVR